VRLKVLLSRSASDWEGRVLGFQPDNRIHFRANKSYSPEMEKKKFICLTILTLIYLKFKMIKQFYVKDKKEFLLSYYYGDKFKTVKDARI
jgi:hypothetical protein